MEKGVDLRGLLDLWALMNGLDPSEVEVREYPSENPQELGIYVGGEPALGTPAEKARDRDIQAQVLEAAWETAAELGLFPSPTMAEDRLRYLRSRETSP